MIHKVQINNAVISQQGSETDKGAEALFQKKTTECSQGDFKNNPQYCSKNMVEDLGNIPGKTASNGIE